MSRNWCLKNIGVTVFQYNSKSYLLFRVGIKGHKSHYYCIYDENNILIAVIARHSYHSNDYRANIYIEDKENLFIALLAFTEEIVCVPQEGDPSAGKYLSILKEEQELFQEDFIEKIKKHIVGGN